MDSEHACCSLWQEKWLLSSLWMSVKGQSRRNAASALLAKGPEMQETYGESSPNNFYHEKTNENYLSWSKMVLPDGTWDTQQEWELEIVNKHK